MALLIRRDPFRDLLDIERNVSRMLEDYGATGTEEQSIVMPSIDVANRGDDLVIHAEMPGIKPEDLDVSLSGGMLTLRGERSEQKETNEDDYVMRERSWGSFERTIQLPGHITADQIEARYNEGVLEVVVHDAAQGKMPQRQQIPLQSGEQMSLEAGGSQQGRKQGGQQTAQGQQGQQSQGRQQGQQQGQHGQQGQQGQQGQTGQAGKQEQGKSREELRESVRSKGGSPGDY